MIPHASSRTTSSAPFRRSPLLLLTMLLSLAPPALADGTWQQTEFMIGAYSDAPLIVGDRALTNRYMKIQKDCGFNLLVGGEHCGGWTNSNLTASPAKWLEVLTSASDQGLKMFVSDVHWEVCPGTTNPGITFAQQNANGWPATILANYDGLSSAESAALWGYNLGDEPSVDTASVVPEFVHGWAGALKTDDASHSGRPARANFINLHVGTGNYPTHRAYIEAIVNKPDSTRRIDVAAMTNYPFKRDGSQACCYFQYIKDLRDGMAGRPFWLMALCDEHAGDCFDPGCDAIPLDQLADVPREEELRFQSLGPVCAGAKGIVWFTYTEQDDELTNRFDELANRAAMPTNRYWSVRTINHFLRDVAGPIVMNSEFLGNFHLASSYPGQVDFFPTSQTNACPISDPGNDSLCVGVWRPNGATLGSEYWVEVFNKGMLAKTATVSLWQSWNVTTSPSVIGYIGGSSFSPVGSGTSFAVSLAGGEGRFYHLTASATDDLKLTSPSGGETWLPASVHTVTWTGTASPVEIRLYTNPLGGLGPISGPYTVLATGASGGSASVTAPNVVSSRAHLVLVSGSKQVTHGAPILTGTGSIHSWTVVAPEANGSAHGYLSAAMTTDGSSNPHVAYYTDSHKLRYAKYTGSWSYIDLATNLASTVGGWSPSITIDGSGNPRIGYVRNPNHTGTASYLSTVGISGGSAGSITDVLAGGNWTLPTTAIANGPSSQTYFAFDGPNGPTLGRAPYTSLYLPQVSGQSRSIALGMDSSGNAWFAYIEDANVLGGTNRLRVCKNAAGGSTVTTSLELPGNFGDVALAMSSNKPRIAYTGRSSDGVDTLYYRAFGTSSWGSQQTVDNTGGHINGVNLAFTGTTPKIAYTNNGILRYAETGSGASWSSQTVLSEEADAPVSLAFTTAGMPWVGFYNRQHDRFELARMEPDPPCDPCDPPIDPAIALPDNNVLRAGDAFSVRMTLPRPTLVAMSLYDVSGRRVAHRGRELVAAGRQTVRWAPSTLGSGVYFLRVDAAGTTRDARVILLR